MKATRNTNRSDSDGMRSDMYVAENKGRGVELCIPLLTRALGQGPVTAYGTSSNSDKFTGKLVSSLHHRNEHVERRQA